MFNRLICIILNMTLIDYKSDLMSLTLTKEMKTLITFYLAWILVHHLSGHVYIYFCTPNTIMGILTSPFMAAAPHCVAIRWVIYEGGNMITTMWVSAGTYIAAKLLTY